MHLRTIYPILLLLAGSVAILPAATVAPEKEPVRPLQPFLIELLDQERGNWIFMDANGQAMRNDGNIRLTGKRPEGRVKEVRILLDDPEFPGDDAHAKKISFPINDNKALLDTGNFKAAIALKETKDGIVAELNQIRLGSAMAAKGIPAMITLWDGERETALTLDGKTPGLKLATDRVGGVFAASEEPVLFVERPDNAAPVGASILVRDYFKDKELSRTFTKLNGGRTRIKLPIDKFGTFVVSVDLGGTSASRRITRIPDARMVEPDRSFVGMNIFQHSIPYLTYQLPLFAKAGVRHLRPWLHWENTWANQEPRKGEFNTAPLDMLLRRMALYNQNYEYTLYKFSPVIGLKSASALELSSLDDEQMKEWQAYVRRIVTHCKGKVNEWEVWNEPDLLNSSKNAGFSGEFYAKFLIATAKAIREADPDAKIHALSHAFLLDWLREVGRTDIRPYLDALTLHSYAGPAKFVSGSEDRQQVIYDMGLRDVPQYYNEIANAGFDLSEAYRKALPNNSERNQAIALPLNYLQSLHLGGPKGRAYWFCSLGPRDGFHDLKWDSTNGLLYVGEQPKAAFPALAAMAWLCDGYTYLGRVTFENGVRYMALSNNRAIVWRDRGEKAVRAVELGALPGEQLTVYDLFGNRIASGAAETITIDFADGPRYVLGSKAMGERAAAAYLQERTDQETAFRLERKVGAFPQPVELKIGESKTVSCPVMKNAEISVGATGGFPAAFRKTVSNGTLEITLTGQSKGAGMLLFTVSSPDCDGSVVRSLPVCVEERAFLFDGGFELGRAVEFPTGPVRFCPNEGNRKPGCIRFDLSDGMHNNYIPKLRVRKGKPIHFKIALKGKLSPQATGHFKLAFFDGPFGSSPWLGDAHPLDFNQEKKAHAKFGGRGIAPGEIRKDRWQTFDVTIPGEQFPADNMAVVLAINFNNCGKEDYLLVDDFEITQEE